MSVPSDLFEEQVFFTTVRIELPNKSSMGTGFLVSIPSPQEGKNYIFLVSNKHVLVDKDEEYRVLFHVKKEGGGPDLGKVFPITIKDLSSGYFCHPNSDLDLACINVSAAFNFGTDLYIRKLNLEHISDYTETDLCPGKEIVFVGYPDDRYDKVNYLPILRGGKMASIPRVDFQGKPFVLLDAQVFKGSSGSPVFMHVENHWRLIGVVCQTMVLRNRLEVVETSQTVTAEQVLGIGLAIKSTAVKELLLHAQASLDPLHVTK